MSAGRNLICGDLMLTLYSLEYMSSMVHCSAACVWKMSRTLIFSRKCWQMPVFCSASISGARVHSSSRKWSASFKSWLSELVNIIYGQCVHSLFSHNFAQRFMDVMDGRGVGVQEVKITALLPFKLNEKAKIPTKKKIQYKFNIYFSNVHFHLTKKNAYSSIQKDPLIRGRYLIKINFLFCKSITSMFITRECYQ